MFCSKCGKEIIYGLISTNDDTSLCSNCFANSYNEFEAGGVKNNHDLSPNRGLNIATINNRIASQLAEKE